MTLRYNYTKKTGRPSKYDPSFNDELDKYLATTGKEQTSLPTIQGFALWLGVDSDTLGNWANTKDEKGELIYPDFFGTLKRLKEIQAQQLIDDGIYGGKEVNATIVKLLLQNNHGMKERNDTTSDDKPIKMPEKMYVEFINEKTNDNQNTN